jgi:hypothetical protein
MAEAQDLEAQVQSIPALLFGVSEALAPFVAAWRALPEDVRGALDRSLADVLGVFPPEQPLTVGQLTELVLAYAVVTPGAEDLLAGAAAEEPAERRCRECGLSDIEQYTDKRTQQPCTWVAEDLCSGCAP